MAANGFAGRLEAHRRLTHYPLTVNSLTVNPLFARELRSRWRDRRAWWLLLALAIVLALLANAVYREGVSQIERQVPVRTRNGVVFRNEQITPSAQAARAGRELFMALAIGNVVAWFLIAPILAATPIARERERGLLEGLQLSHITPRSQIVARCGAALAFLLLLQLAVAPIYTTIFWLGGVSPGELAWAGAIIGCTALGGVALGTYISARSYRPSSALFTALGIIILWTLALYPAAMLAFGTGGRWAYAGAVVVWTHPLPLIWSVADVSGQMAGYLPFGWESGDLVLAVCAVWALVSAAFLALAIPLVRKPLTPASWETKASAPVERWRGAIRAREAAVQQRENRRSQRVESALVADIPIDKWIHFSNPLLEREVRSRFRLRRGNWVIMLGRFALFGTGILVWLSSIYALADTITRRDVASQLLYMLWGLGALAVGALASSGFARERESGTWEGLKLSLMKPLEIVRAKWMSPLWAFAIYAAPLWLLVPFGVAWGEKLGMEPLALALSIGIVVLSLGTISMIGLLISWRARHPNTALGWVLGLGLFLFVGVPILREATGIDPFVTEFLYGVRVRPYRGYSADTDAEHQALNFQYVTSFWHPITALNFVQDWQNNARNLGSDSLAPRVALEVQLAVFIMIVGGGGWVLKREIARDKARGESG